MGISEMPVLHLQPSWWFHQPIWKILIRQNWEFIFPKDSGWKYPKNIWNHHQPGNSCNALKIPSRPSPWGVAVTPPAPAALPPPNWGEPGAAPKKQKNSWGVFFSGGAKPLRVSERLCLDFGMFKHLNSWVLLEMKTNYLFLLIDSEKWKLRYIIYIVSLFKQNMNAWKSMNRRFFFIQDLD